MLWHNQLRFIDQTSSIGMIFHLKCIMKDLFTCQDREAMSHGSSFHRGTLGTYALSYVLYSFCKPNDL